MLSKETGIRPEMKRIVNATIKKVSEDYEAMKYNTAIAQMMTMVNEVYAKGDVTKEEMTVLLTVLSPVAPHISEELNEILGNTTPLYASKWPEWDESALVEESIEYGVQVNSRIRGRMTMPANADRSAVETAALQLEDVKPFVDGKTVKKIIVVKNIVNIIVG